MIPSFQLTIPTHLRLLYPLQDQLCCFQSSYSLSSICFLSCVSIFAAPSTPNMPLFKSFHSLFSLTCLFCDLFTCLPLSLSSVLKHVPGRLFQAGCFFLFFCSVDWCWFYPIIIQDADAALYNSKQNAFSFITFSIYQTLVKHQKYRIISENMIHQPSSEQTA